MSLRTFSPVPYDEPPVPQEPPQNHTPLSPPRPRKNPGQRPSTASGVMTSVPQNPDSVQHSPPRPQTPKERARSVGEMQRPLHCLGNSSATDTPVSKDETRLMAPDTFTPVDKCPPGAGTKNMISITVSAPPAEDSKADTKEHVSVLKNKSQSAPSTCGVQTQGKRAPIRGRTSQTTTTIPSLMGSPRIPGHPYASTTQAAAGTETYFAIRRDSVDTDGRSLISSFLDAYCRSETGDEEAGSRWPDDTSTLSGDTVSLNYASDSTPGRSRDRPDSDATAVSTNDTPKRSKPASLVLTSTTDWEGASKANGLPSTPQTAPAAVARSARPLPPLPPLPPVQRQIRPLPRPPAPPPYTSPVDSPPLRSVSFQSSASSSTTSSPSSQASTSITSVSTRSSTEVTPDRLYNQPNISKRPIVPPILTNPASSCSYPSPLTPNIPVPPSPMTAKRHQASKLSKMLGEEITPDILDARKGISRWSSPDSRPSGIIQIGKKINNRLGLTDIQSTPAPLPTSRDPEISNVRLRSRAARPQAIYLFDGFSDEMHEKGDCAESVEEGSTSEPSTSENSNTNLDITIHFAAEEGLDDKPSLSSGDEDDSILDDLDDLEEAHIGWALQNVVTYQKESHVKRATRAWVLERNGQRWEEQDYSNVLNALRQL